MPERGPDSSDRRAQPAFERAVTRHGTTRDATRRQEIELKAERIKERLDRHVERRMPEKIKAEQATPHTKETIRRIEQRGQTQPHPSWIAPRSIPAVGQPKSDRDAQILVQQRKETQKAAVSQCLV